MIPITQVQRDALIDDCKKEVSELDKHIARLKKYSFFNLEANEKKLLRAKIILASLEADITGWQFLGANGKWIGLMDEFGKQQAEREGCEVRANYTALPVPVLKPVAPPKPMKQNWPGISYTAATAFDQQDDLWKQAIREAGHPIAGEDNNHIPDAGKMIIPPGWKLVPVEPTDEMITAGDVFMFGTSQLGDAYEAMLDAAPEPK